MSSRPAVRANADSDRATAHAIERLTELKTIVVNLA
jgi:hypothetical protein